MDLIQLIELRNQKLKQLESLVNEGKVEKRKLSSVENERFNEITKDIEDLDTQINLKQKGEVRNKTSKNKMENFSLLKAIEARANGLNYDETAIEVIKAGKEEMRNAGLSSTGDIVLPISTRALIAAQTATQGQEIVQEDKYGILDPIRESLVLVKAGATFLTGLKGDVSLPAYSGTNALWKGEGVQAADGAGTFSEITLAPKRITAYIDVSKQFLSQDSIAAEAMLRRDIVNAVSAKLESTVFGKAAAVPGVSPAGFFAVAPTNKGLATFDNMVKMESDVEAANVNGYVYIMNSGAKGILKTTPKVVGQPVYILDGNEMNGYPVIVSNHVAKELQVGADEFGVVFGDFSQFIIGQWGGLDITVDALSQAINGNVRIVVNAYFDAAMRNSNAFATASIK